jgi:hypothetical protein
MPPTQPASRKTVSATEGEREREREREREGRRAALRQRATVEAARCKMALATSGGETERRRGERR